MKSLGLEISCDLDLEKSSLHHRCKGNFEYRASETGRIPNANYM